MSDTEVKALAVIGANQQALANIDYGEDAGGGFENTTSADFKTPWLRVLDAKSKQVESGLPGAKAGLICNTITNALYATTLFVPAVTEAYYVEWKPRNQGGGGGKGFVGVHKPTEPMVVAALADLAKKGGKFAKGPDGKNLLPKSPAGWDLVETFYVHGLQIDEETGDTAQAMIAFSSTGIPVYQGWLAQADSQKTGPADARKAKPLFAHAYRLGTAKQEGNGNSWWNFTVRFAGEGAQSSLLDLGSDIYAKAKAIKAEVLAGKVKVDHAGSETPAAGEKDAEIPF
jgi:hypothetical protein